MITPEKKKGKYIYYHCTEYNGKHGASWVREEELTSQFAQLFESLQIPKDIIEEITTSLRHSHRSKAQFHRAMLESYKGDLQKYQTRIERMYDDKLDGSITERDYNKRYERYREKQKEITSRIERLSIADEEYYITSEYLLRLANRAHELFMSSEAEERRQLLQLTLQNLKLDGKSVKFEFVRPFDKVFACSSSQSWLPELDSIQQPSG